MRFSRNSYAQPRLMIKPRKEGCSREVLNDMEFVLIGAYPPFTA
jgi:hypothetical protein